MPKLRSGISKQTGPVAPVVLGILDGWGYSKETEHNAIHSADTPIMDALWSGYPHTLIEASGADVGLPDQQMGNSEVGHMIIGSGKIFKQDLVIINESINDGSFFKNEAIKNANSMD